VAALVFVSHAYGGPVVGHQPKQVRDSYKQGELLVKFKSGVTESTKEAVHARIGSEVIKEFHFIRVQHVKLPDGLTVEKAIGTYESDANVQYAEPVQIVETQNRPEGGVGIDIPTDRDH
jgi:hypothetical protein